MKRLVLSAATAAAAALLVTGVSTSSYAATGTFVYHDHAHHPHRINNPVTDKCYNVHGVGSTLNLTDAHALLYAHPNCVGTAADDLKPAETHNEASFRSVRFIA
ncbi:hypothetical protein [Streptomyces flaveolus]|uniref:hypothetical protein n=1 Tax=Streptomyces flaveolus TaxID=67297 RepID=UPI0033F76417